MDLTPIPTGNDLQVNTTTTGSQRLAAVAALTGGGFVVTWQSEGQDGSGAGIYAQRYAPDGTAVGSEFRVNTFTTDDQVWSSVAALAGGGFVVTWSSFGQDGSGFGMYGQCYAPDGTAVGSEFRVNTFTTHNQLYPSVAALGGGGFVVTWTSDGQDDIYGQRYAPDGTAVGSEFRVNTFTTGLQVWSSVAALADGGFVFTWQSEGQEGSGADIYGQRYAADGTAVGSEFRVNTFTTDHQVQPSVTALAGGGFVVTWSSRSQDGSASGVYGQRYAADGTAVGSEFRVNTYTADLQAWSSVAALAGGSFVVTWSSLDQDGSGYGIYGQRYAADGTAEGREFRVNQITAGHQIAERFYGFETVATLADGRLVQVWAGTGTEEVFFRLINVPNTVNDTATTNEDTPVNILVQANDAFETTPAITGTTNGAHGTTAVNNNGTVGNTADDFVVYTPTADFNGTDSFTYTVTSGGVTETATVSLTVNAIADIVADAATTNEDTSVTILVLANDTFESTPAITGTTDGAHGTVAVNNNGTPGNTADDFVVYTPAPDFNGTDAFTYTVTSGGDIETGTVSVTVTAVADIVADSVTVAQDSGANDLNLLANDTFENLARAITAVGAAAHGTTVINDNATPGTADDFVVYTPTVAYNGPDTFSYTVTSGGVTETATVSVAVTAPPPPLPPASTTPTSGNDDITGTDGPDTIVTLAGDDIVDGRGGNDLLFGNQGSDALHGGTGDDTLVGGQDNDLVQGEDGNDLLFGNEGADTIVGGDGANTIVGGQDSFDAADLITSGSGNDLIFGNGGADTIVADGGANTIVGGFGSDSIVTGAGDDIVLANQDNDTVDTGDGADIIVGGFGDDSISAGTGNDTVFGSEGNDTKAGGTGADRYVFLIGSGNDQINGFSGSAEGDRLDLQGRTFTTGTSADGDLLLLLSGGGTIELNGVAPANFSPGFVL